MSEIDVQGLLFPEGPRWRHGAFWVSDQLGDRIIRIEEHGAHETVCRLAGPSGLGFDEQGRLLAVTMREARLVGVENGEAHELVDLRSVSGILNDMCVTDEGRCYIDAYETHEGLSTQRLLLVGLDGSVEEAAADLIYPNGVAVSADGATLIVSETFAGRLSAFDVGPDGRLSGRRVWAVLPEGDLPDGLCLDEQGDVWVASYQAGSFLHVREGGEILDSVQRPGRWAMACALGGADGRTLLLCMAETTTKDYVAGRATGHIETVRVAVPGIGRP